MQERIGPELGFDMSDSEDASRALVARLRAGLAAAGISSRAAAIEAGLGPTAIHDILNGRNKNPSVRLVSAIARVLGVDTAYLLGQQETPKLDQQQNLSARTIKIVGAAEAGAFRIMQDVAGEAFNLPEIQGPPSQRYPTARHFALEVRGDSMNDAKPHPIMDGSFVLCVDMVDAQLPVENGHIYAVRRTIDGGQTFECTIKRAKVFRNRVELWPESTNGAHKPITVPRNFEDDTGQEVQAIGLVYANYNSFE